MRVSIVTIVIIISIVISILLRYFLLFSSSSSSSSSNTIITLNTDDTIHFVDTSIHSVNENDLASVDDFLLANLNL